MKTERTIVDDVLSPSMSRDIWTGNYDKILPISTQSFELSAVLPAVFYMFRFGQRRGKGKFLETFGAGGTSPRERRKSATIKRIAEMLARNDEFNGFDSEARKAILGDLLLCFCLENSKHSLGREEQIQRVAPTHYMASWVDLPERIGHLRFVPEMIVAMLADQKGEHVKQNTGKDKTRFAVGRGYEKNILLQAFSQGISQRGGLAADVKADEFDECNDSVGLDQLLMIRLAQQLGKAPDKLRDNKQGEISNQHPISEKATRYFSEDIRGFVGSYANIIPRRTFVELLESCISVGITTIFTSVFRILFDWAKTGEITKNCEQQPEHLFIDCSNGINRQLRLMAEQSMDDFMRRVQRFSVIMMVLRLLDHNARYDNSLKKFNAEHKPNATNWLNLLGDLLHGRRKEAKMIFYVMEQKAQELADRLNQEDYTEAVQILRNLQTEPNPIWRLAEALTLLQGRKNTEGKLTEMIDSAMLIGRPNSLASKRSITRTATGTTTRRRREIRSLIFTDSVLDYLVHRHLLCVGKKTSTRRLSFKEFIQIIRDRYGFCVDSAPPGIPIPNNLLQANRAILERRLRDLGLLVGVNDAEAMKHLEPRFSQLLENS